MCGFEPPILHAWNRTMSCAYSASNQAQGLKLVGRVGFEPTVPKRQFYRLVGIPVSPSDPLCLEARLGIEPRSKRVLQTRAFAILPPRREFGRAIRTEFFVLYRERDNLFITTRGPDHVWWANQDSNLGLNLRRVVLYPT